MNERGIKRDGENERNRESECKSTEKQRQNGRKNGIESKTEEYTPNSVKCHWIFNVRNNRICVVVYDDGLLAVFAYSTHTHTHTHWAEKCAYRFSHKQEIENRPPCTRTHLYTCTRTRTRNRIHTHASKENESENECEKDTHKVLLTRIMC